MDEQKTEMKTSVPLFKIWLCGTFRIERNTERGYQLVLPSEWGGSSYPRLLLKALLCCPERRAGRASLPNMLWPNCEAKSALPRLNTATTKLRTLLRPAQGQESILITEDNATVYRLADQSLLWVDIDEVLALMRNFERIGRDHPECLPLLEEAITYLDRGPFLEGEEGRWLFDQRKNIEETRYRCRHWLAEAYEQFGMKGQAEAILSALLRENHQDEDVLCRLMSLLHRQGMTHKARTVYQETKHSVEGSGSHLSQNMICFAERIFNEPPDGAIPLS